MVARVTTVAIAIGGACGALTALVGSPGASLTPRESPRPAGTLTSSSRTSNAGGGSGPEAALGPHGGAAASASAPLGAGATPTLAAPTASAAPGATPTLAAPTASAAPGASSSASVSQAQPSAPPATPRALLLAEMRCDQKDAAGCYRAALGYELGSAGPADPEKAANYRKIGLTLWMIQCDHNSPTACATLAELYRAGLGVPQSEKIATALVTRTRELCRYNDVPACRSLPNP